MKKITADLKCTSCGRTWVTTQAELKTPFPKSSIRTSHPEFLPLVGDKARRCPRCHGTLWLELIEPEEYETDLLVGA